MTKPSLATASWISLAAGTFALGWILKPGQDSARDNDGGTSSLSAVSASQSSSSRISGHHSAMGGAGGASGKPATAGPLTAAGIAALGEEFRSTRDPLARREAFARLIAGLTVENALEVREQIAHLAPDSAEFRDFHFAWGKIGGKEAVLHGAGTDKQDMAPTMAGWASANPAAARAWYEALPEKSEKPPRRGQMKEAIVQGLAIADPAKAVEFVTALHAAGDSGARQMMGIVTGKILESAGPAGAAAWASNLPEGELRGSALSDVARAMAREDPASAAVWARGMVSDNEGGAIVSSISSEWGRRDGAATVQWLDSLSGDQSASYGPAVAGWAKSDPLAASQHIAAMPPSGSRNNAIGGLVYSYRWEDPVAAVTWANEISDPKKRQDALFLAAEAYARKDPAGAAAWLPASGLPAATQERLLSSKR